MRYVAFALALALAPTNAAAPVEGTTPDSAILSVSIERDGKPLFSPRLLVRLGEMAEASMSSPTGESHRLVLSVNRHDEGAYRFRSLYLTKAAPTANWIVRSEPAFVARDASPASMALADASGKERLRFGIHIRGGTAEELRALWARELQTSTATPSEK